MTEAFWPRLAAAGEPLAAARIKLTPEDFMVTELPSWAPSGDGEHDVLWVEKRNANTRWVADQLASFAGIPASRVSYAGLKDRHAVTRQWFSVHTPGSTTEWAQCDIPDVRILDCQRHCRKLRIGTLAGNAFEVRLHHDGIDSEALKARVDHLADNGLPNYFGPQRFGRDGDNLKLASALASGRRLTRSKRGFALSAARAMIFNDVLEQRIEDGSWVMPRAGDVAMLTGSRSVFLVKDEELDQLVQRANDFDLHVSGPLWGRGTCATGGDVATMEQAAAARYPELVEAVERGGADMQRRALRVRAEKLSVDMEASTVVLKFELPAGSFATALLNELVALR
ncbi:MAG: tRNA pseudouridine(13) synthase TruD [Woeseiaceae bacterium]